MRLVRLKPKRILAITTALISLGLLQPIPTAAQAARTVRYTDTGFDPNDVPVDHTSCCQQDPDIRSTARKVWVDKDGRRWLTISFGTYEWLTGYWGVLVFLDTRGGPRWDATMSMFEPGGTQNCRFRWRDSTLRVGHVRFTVDHEFCRVPLGWARTDKRIRWRLFSRGGGEGTGPAVDERAPDSGMYV